MKKTLFRGVIVSAAATLTLPAFAHNTFTTQYAPAGYVQDLEMRVTHGCKGSPVNSVRIKIPEGVYRVTVNNNRDWNRDRNRNDNGDWNRNDNTNQDRRGRNWDRYDNYGGSFELRQTALNAGYNEGMKQGRNDQNRNNNSDYRNNGAYQKATTDYSSKLGDRSLYQRYYRTGYENGYYDGLNGN